MEREEFLKSLQKLEECINELKDFHCSSIIHINESMREWIPKHYIKNFFVDDSERIIKTFKSSDETFHITLILK